MLYTYNGTNNKKIGRVFCFSKKIIWFEYVHFFRFFSDFCFKLNYTYINVTKNVKKNKVIVSITCTSLFIVLGTNSDLIIYRINTILEYGFEPILNKMQ